MKRILCMLLALAMLFVVSFEVVATGEPEKTVEDTDFKVLPAKTDEPLKLRTRKKVDGLRLYVDEENPLFMIRNCPIWNGPQTGEAFAEYAIKTYNALPEDIRNFAVIYIDEGTTDMTPSQP